MSGPAKRYPWKWYAALLLLAGISVPPLLYLWAERTITARRYLIWEGRANQVHLLTAAGIGLVLVVAAALLAGLRSDRAVPAWRARLAGFLVASALGTSIGYGVSLLGYVISGPR